jgi:uncharacterized protein (DUF2252 family)
MNRTWKHLARERLEDVKPSIPRGERFWAISRDEQKAIEGLFDGETARQLVASLKARSDGAKIEVLDAAYWMKGCSSLGRMRFAVLLRVSNGKRKEDEFCLMDIKEANVAAAPRAARAAMPSDDAKRVVEGAKHLSPALGDRMMAARLLDHSVFLRELMPQDLKLEIDQFTRSEATRAARYLASVIGKAHARQMDEPTRAAWRRTLNDHRGSGLDAPSWLWRSVVDLMARHEAGYLDHCRRYALEAGA